MTRALLDYFATDRASPLCSQNKRDKNSNRNSARVACLMKFVGGDTHTRMPRQRHCSNGVAIMATDQNVIPRSEATWESPK